MYTVKEIAQLVGVPSDTVRHYTRIKLLNPVRDPANGYTKYSNNDVNKLRFICLSKRLGYTLNDIRKIFEDCEKGDSPCPRVREIIQKRIAENRHLLKQQVMMQDRMEDALIQWSVMKDGSPDGKTICKLIESINF